MSVTDQLRRAGRALRDPGLVLRRLSGARARPAQERAHPLRVYAERARAAGLTGLCLFLSFDCDTDRDIDLLDALEDLLEHHGIARTYAVPGEQLRRGRDAYRRLAGRGAAFMNHGDRPHAEWREDRYHSVTRYDLMSSAEVVADIQAGDRTVREVTGYAPAGFRAPHFGGFQEPAQLRLVHDTAYELGYRYCSTTGPRYGLEYGPVFSTGRMVEIPTFGSFRHPTTILDSWTYLEDRRDYRLGETYLELFEETIDRMTAESLPGVLSYYADPSHVVGQRPFERAMEAIARRGIPSVTPEQLLAGTRPPLVTLPATPDPAP